MSIFSLNWFKSKKERQIEELKHEIKVKELQKKLEEIENSSTSSSTFGQAVDTSRFDAFDTSTTNKITKPYKNVKLINDVLTVVLNDGSIVSKPNATAEDFDNVRNALDESEILNVMTDQEVLAERKKHEAEVARIKILQNGIQSLKGLNDFVVEGNTVYLKGINRSLPQILVEEFIELVEKNKYYAGFGNLEQKLADDEKFQSLKRFFMWCCLNPRAEVANELYRFLKENSFRITKQGFFVALRNVVTVSDNTNLVTFVSNTYNKIKAVWKKSPHNYRVMENDGEYSIELVTDINPKGTIVGNLASLYFDLPNLKENRFTDDWTRTFDIRIGRVVNMPMEKCDWSTQDCAAAGLKYVASL